MMKFADSQRGKPYSKDPAVVKFNGKYFLYYSIPPVNPDLNEKGWGIGIASGTDLVNWEVVGTVSQDEPYEQKGLCAAGAIVLDNTVHIFYQTYGNGKNDAICHAFSKDGVLFEKDKSNPIFMPTTDWCCGRAIDADVVKWGDKLFLYFATRDFAFQTQMLGVAAAPVGSSLSKSDFTQMINSSILKPELPWEKKCIEAPAMCCHDNKLYMFYAGAYNNEPQQIGCAVSTDGINFTRISEQPILPNGSEGEWNYSESGHPFVFQDDDGRDYLFFQGNNDNGKSWYISFKEIIWENGFPTLK